MLGGDLCPGSGEGSRKKEPWEAGQDLLHTRTYMLGKQSLPSQPLHGNPYRVLLEVSSLCHPQGPPNPHTHLFFLNLSTSWKFEKWKEGYRNPCRLGEEGHSLIEARVLKPLRKAFTLCQRCQSPYLMRYQPLPLGLGRQFRLAYSWFYTSGP